MLVQFGETQRIKLQHYLAGALLALLAGGIYYPTLFSCYGLQDDYAYLWVVTFEHWHYFDLIGAMGRPLYQLLSQQVFALADSICDLNSIRAFTLLTAWGLALQCYGMARRYGWSAIMAFALAAAWLSAPAVGLMVAWAITFPFLFALSLSLLAGELVWQAVARSRFHAGWRLSVAAALLFTALLVYQHAAMGYWLVVALVCFSPRGFRWPGWSALLLWIGLFISVLLIYYLAYQIYLQHLIAADSMNLHAAERASITTDILAKLRFLYESLQLTLSIGQFTFWPVLIYAVSAVISAALLREVWRQRSVWPVLGALALVVAIYLPSLLVVESLLKVRLLIVLGLLVLFGLLWALQVLLPQHQLHSALALMLIAYLAISEHFTVQRLVELNQAEAQAVQSALQEHYSAASSQIAIVRPVPANWDGGASWLIEYGTPTMAVSADFARVLVQQLFAETFKTRRLPDVLQCPEANRSDCATLQEQPALPVLDLGRLLRQQLAPDWPETVSD
ncbi:MAG: hypothetical protein R3F53_11080 [Gammaproteobacteria bacterium]